MNKRLTTIAFLLGSTLALTACAGGTSADSDPDSAALGTLKIGVMPIADLAPFHYALEEGMFEDEELEIEIVSSSAGASLITSTVAGDLDITYTNFVSFVQGVEQGLPLVAIRENNRSGPQGIYAMDGSGITSGEDLEGKSIAINSLGNIQELTTRAVLANLPTPVRDINFVELPPADMESALEAGNVDAAWLVEPFLTRANESDTMHRVIDAFTGPTESIPVAGWLSTADFIAENEDAVQRFVAVLDHAMQDIAENPEIFNDTIPQFTEIPPELAARLQEPSLTPESQLITLNDLEKLMVEFGPLTSSVDLSGSIYGND